jgi:branched-chain amino acid transport system substrate-binding protein
MEKVVRPLAAWYAYRLVQAYFAKTARSNKLYGIIFAFIIGVGGWLAACQQTAPPATTPPLQITAVPVIIEVTRVITHTIVVTPEPSASVCPPYNLGDTTEVVLGALLPFSKLGAMQKGFAMQTAFTIAVENINARGGIQGKPVRLITYDDSGVPERAITLATRLLREDCAAMLVGVYHSEVARAVKEVAHKYGIPIIFSEPHVDDLTADQYPEVFRIGPTSTMYAQMPGKWLAKVGDYNGDETNLAVIVGENSPHGVEQVKAIQGWLPQYGFTGEAVLVDLPSTNFSSVIARIVALDKLPDAIFIQIAGETAFDLERQILEAGLTAQKGTLIVNNALILNDQRYWQQVPNGVYAVATQIGPWPSTVTPLGKQFAIAYQQYFDRWPERYAFGAYDAIQLAADAIDRAGTLDPAAIIAALETADIELASGHYQFPYTSKNPPDGDKVPAYLWHQWLNPQLLYLQYSEVDQAGTEAAVIWPEIYRTIDGPLLATLFDDQ